MRNDALRLKQSRGWFAATSSFRDALEKLSDGAFKLFACVCLDADRPTGRLRASQKDLAARLGKSRRAVACHIKELEQKGICTVEAGRNQFATSRFQVSEAYWPYVRAERDLVPSGKGGVESASNQSQSPRIDQPVDDHWRDSSGGADYVASIRECFLDLGCTRGTFSSSDERVAQRLMERAIPLRVVLDAMLLGAYRKYESWLNRRFDPSAPPPESHPIVSLSYFEQLIEEVSKTRISSQQREALGGKLRFSQRRWKQIAERNERAAVSVGVGSRDGKPTGASSDKAIEPGAARLRTSDPGTSPAEPVEVRATETAAGARALRKVLLGQKGSKHPTAACAKK